MLKAFNFRIYPTDAQKQQLIHTFGCVHFTYNHLLKARQADYLATNRSGRFFAHTCFFKKRIPILKRGRQFALANAQLIRSCISQLSLRDAQASQTKNEKKYVAVLYDE